MQEKPKLIVITPVKNESWILEKFLIFTSLWADYIIIADQNSTDNSIEIAQKFEKVIIVKNEGEYNEFERTKILLREARKIEGKKIIFALDADEFLSANYMDSPEWQTILNAPEKTLFNIERLNLTPNFKNYFGGLRMIIALVDDNSASIEETSMAIIHNIRLPWPKNAQVIHLNDIKILHLDYVSEKRVLSKLRWYQCFEKFKFNHSDKYLRDKYLFFNNMNNFLKDKNCLNINKNWTQNFISHKLDFTSYKEPFLWWDDELFNLFNQVGIQKFKNLDIHQIDWMKKAKERNYSNIDNFKIRRGIFEKIYKKGKEILNQIELN
jgi:hypothetical protein